MRREIQCEGASHREKFIFGEMRTCPLEHRYRKCFHTFPSRASSPVRMLDQTCSVKRREKQIGKQKDEKTQKKASKWEGGCQKKREKRLLRSLLLTILERSAVARATSGTRDWYLEQRSSGIAAENLMFGTHLGSTNTLHLFSCFSDTLPASSLQPTRSPYCETPRGWCPIFFHCFALVLHEPQPSLLMQAAVQHVYQMLWVSSLLHHVCVVSGASTFSTVAITPVSCFVRFLHLVLE